MTTKPQNEAAVGFFVIVGFILLTLIVFFVSGVYFFRPGYTLNVMYDYVSILDKGAPVRMAGVRVGEVSKVDLIYVESLQRTRVKVKLFIEKRVEIRENYLFKIQGTHVLSEPHIEITPEVGDKPLLKDGETLEGMTPISMEDLIDQGHDIAGNLNQVTHSMGAVLTRIDKGEGTVGKLMSKDELYQDMRDFMAEIKAHPWRLLKRDGEKRKFLFF